MTGLNPKVNSGFTLAEVLIYTAVIGVVSTLFTGILLTVTGIQGRGNTSTELEQQSNFVIQTAQRLIKSSSLIDISTGTPNSILKLRRDNAAKDPTQIYLDSEKIFIQEGAAAPAALTTDKVKISNLAFTKISTYPGHDSVQINFTISFNSLNQAEQASKNVETAVSRSGTALFDYSPIPETNNSYDLGSQSQKWRSLYLSGNADISGGLLILNGQDDEPPGTDGQIYYNADLGTFRVRQNNVWSEIGRWNYASTTDSIYNSNSSNVGIGTNSPPEKLTVNGSMSVTGFKMATAAGEYYILTAANADGTAQWGPGVNSGEWELIGNDINNKNTNGNVGIGSTTPYQRLEVSGDLIIDGPVPATTTGNYNPPGNARGVFVIGNHAFLASAGIQIFDIADPANPQRLGHFNPELDGPRNVSVSGNYAYLSSGIDGFTVIDISNLSSPILAGRYDTSGDAKDIYISGRYAYVADGSSGLQIIDIADSANPTLVGNYNTTGDSQGIYLKDNYAYVADGASGLQIINVSDPSSPSLAGTYNTTGTAKEIYVSGNYAYVADGTGGLKIINIIDPANPTQAGYHDTAGDANGIFISGKYAYIADDQPLISVVDISNPAQPFQTGTFDNAKISNDIYISGKYAYLSVAAPGINILDIFGGNFNSASVASLETNHLNSYDNLRIDGNLDAGAINGGLNGITATDNIESADYLHFGKKSAGAPPSGDCDNDSETGRLLIDTTNNRLYVCMGQSRGWDYASLNN